MKILNFKIKFNERKILLDFSKFRFHKDIDHTKDYYRILNISKSATESEIKLAYRKLAKQYHPDVNKSPEAVDKFKEITSAYEVLSDKDKKSIYDSGHGPSSSGFNTNANPFNGFRGFNGFDPFKEFRKQQAESSKAEQSRANQSKQNNFYSNFDFTNNSQSQQYKKTFTYKDPRTGQYKTYTFTSFSNNNENPFYTDFNEALRRRRQQRNQQNQHYNDYQKNQSQNQQNPYDQFNNNNQQNRSSDFFNDSFNYQQQMHYYESIRIFKWTLFTILFIFLYSRMLKKRRDYYEQNQFYEPNYNQFTPYNSYYPNQNELYNKKSNQYYYGDKDNGRMYFNRDEVPPYK